MNAPTQVQKLAQVHSLIEGRQKLILALGIFIVLTAVGLIARPLLPIDETRYVGVAWEMWNSGNYLIPTLNGEMYTHKPPMLFWLINLMWQVTGVSELSARLIGPLAGLTCVLLTYVLGQTLWPDRQRLAGKASLITVTTGFFLIFASLSMFDALLSVGVLICYIALFKFDRTKSEMWLVLLAAGIAFGVFAKGPVIFVHVLPLVFILPFMRSSGFYRHKRDWATAMILSLLIAIPLVGSWLVPALATGGQAYFEAAIWHQAVDRMSNAFDHQQPVWFYLQVLPLIIWPWGWVTAIWKKSVWKECRDDFALKALGLSVIICFALFSLISGKQVHYLLPEVSLIALMLARGLENTGKFSLWLPLGLFVVVCVGLGLTVFPDLLPLRHFGSFITLQPVLSAIGVGIAALGTLIWLDRRQFYAAAAIAPVMVLTIYMALCIPLQKSYSAVPIGNLLRLNEGQAVAYAGNKYHGMFNFSGRLTEPVAVLPTLENMAKWRAKHPKGLLIARMDRVHPDRSPTQMFVFRNRDYGVFGGEK